MPSRSHSRSHSSRRSKGRKKSRSSRKKTHHKVQYTSSSEEHHTITKKTSIHVSKAVDSSARAPQTYSDVDVELGDVDAQAAEKHHHEQDTVKSRERERYQTNILTHTRFIRILLHLTGRYPFHMERSDTGTHTCSWTLFRPQGLYFLVVSLVTMSLLIVGTLNLADIYLNVTFGDGKDRPLKCQLERMYEVTLVDRNIVAFCAIWTSLCQLALASVSVYFKREYFAKYFTYLFMVASTVHANIAEGVLKFSTILIVTYLVLMGASVALGAFVSTSTRGVPSLFSILIFRPVRPCLMEREDKDPPTGLSETHTSLALVSTGVICIIFLASKSLILLFIIVCRMIVNAFKIWNHRFHGVINKPKKHDKTTEARTTYELLFKDHCTLLNLIEGTDNCFSTIVEAFVALQIVAMIMDVFFVYRTVTWGASARDHHEEEDFMDSRPPFYERRWDFISGIVYLSSNLFLLGFLLKEASKISQIANEGLEVIRRKTMMERKKIEELWFTLSMFSSYTSHDVLALKGSGFFIINNDFILTVSSVIFSMTVAIIQFDPPLDPDYRGNRTQYYFQALVNNEKREKIGRFLVDLEGQKNKHWENIGTNN